MPRFFVLFACAALLTACSDEPEQAQYGASPSLPEPQRDLLRKEYEQVRSERLPVSRTYTASFDGEEQTWERLVLPFFGPDGEVVKLLVADYRLEA